MPEDNKKIKVNLVSKKDLKFSYFCGGGNGGQAKNKIASGVQINHEESGAIGRASDSRSLHQNKEQAFIRLTSSPKFKFWLARRLYELDMGEKIEETIDSDLKNPKNLKYEIKLNGKWEEIPAEYFDTDEAKKEE